MYQAEMLERRLNDWKEANSGGARIDTKEFKCIFQHPTINSLISVLREHVLLHGHLPKLLQARAPSRTTNTRIPGPIYGADDEFQCRVDIATSNVDDRISGFESTHKYDFITIHRAIHLGDRLTLTFSDGAAEGVVLPRTSKPVKLPIRITTTPYLPSSIIDNCTGPAEFIEAMEEHHRAQRGPVRGSDWRAVGVVAQDGTDLGSLHRVRQVCHVWLEEKEAWAIRNGLPRPRQRRKGKDGLINARPWTR